MKNDADPKTHVLTKSVVKINWIVINLNDAHVKAVLSNFLKPYSPYEDKTASSFVRLR